MTFETESEFREFLYALHPEEFEFLIAELWSELGWSSNVTELSGDSGIDVVATKESPFPEKQLIQVKRYGPDSTVSSPEIQQYASLRQQEDNVDSVIVVTSSTFSREAQGLAEKLNVKLVDGKGLYEILEREGLFHIVADYSSDDDFDNDLYEESSDTKSETEKDTPVHSKATTQPFNSAPVTLKWESETGERQPQVLQSDETVFVGGGNNHLHAIECGAGITRWKAKLPDSIRCIAANEESIFVGCKDYYAYSVNQSTGEGNWSLRTDGYIGAIAESDGIVCIRAHSSENSTLYAVDADSGEILWSFEDGTGTHFGHITIEDDVVYYASNNRLFSIDLYSGTVEWQITEDDHFTIPEVRGDSVFVCNYEHSYLHSIDAKSGIKQWSFETGKGIRSSPRVLGDTIFVGCQDSHLYAINRENGSERWRFGTRGPVKIPPEVTEKSVYCASSLGIIYAVDPIDGELIESYEFENSLYSTTAMGRAVYIAGKKGNISAVEFPK